MKKLVSSILVCMLLLSMAICFVGCSEKGSFISLSDAYERNLITLNDVKNIAYYYQGSTFENFTPQALTKIDKSIEKAIKKSYLVELRKDIPNANMDGVHIRVFYGCYHGCYVVEMWDDYRRIDPIGPFEISVGGIRFDKMYSPGLILWTML